MTETDTQAIIGRLLSCFTINRPDPDAFLDEFAKAIAGTSTEALHKAIDEGMRTWSFFPVPAELLSLVKKQTPAKVYQSPNWEQEQRKPRTPAQLAANRKLMADLFVHFDNARKPMRSDDKAAARDRFLSAQSRPGEAIRRAISRKDLAAGERE